MKMFQLFAIDFNQFTQNYENCDRTKENVIKTIHNSK